MYMQNNVSLGSHLLLSSSSLLLLGNSENIMSNWVLLKLSVITSLLCLDLLCIDFCMTRSQ